MSKPTTVNVKLYLVAIVAIMSLWMLFSMPGGVTPGKGQVVQPQAADTVESEAKSQLLTELKAVEGGASRGALNVASRWNDVRIVDALLGCPLVGMLTCHVCGVQVAVPAKNERDAIGFNPCCEDMRLVASSDFHQSRQVDTASLTEGRIFLDGMWAGQLEVITDLEDYRRDLESAVFTLSRTGGAPELTRSFSLAELLERYPSRMAEGSERRRFTISLSLGHSIAFRAEGRPSLGGQLSPGCRLEIDLRRKTGRRVQLLDASTLAPVRGMSARLSDGFERYSDLAVSGGDGILDFTNAGRGRAILVLDEWNIWHLPKSPHGSGIQRIDPHKAELLGDGLDLATVLVEAGGWQVALFEPNRVPVKGTHFRFWLELRRPVAGESGKRWKALARTRHHVVSATLGLASAADLGRPSFH